MDAGIGSAMRRIGFDAADKTRVKLVRPSDIMTVDPVIQICFDRGYFCWGDNPCLRWAVNNTKRVRSSKKGRNGHGQLYLRKNRRQEPKNRYVYGACRRYDRGICFGRRPAGGIAVHRRHSAVMQLGSSAERPMTNEQRGGEDNGIPFFQMAARAGRERRKTVRLPAKN